MSRNWSSRTTVSQRPNSKPWVVPVIMLGALSFVYFLQWRSSQNQSERIAALTARVSSAAQNYERKAQADSMEMQALLRAVRKNLEGFSAQLARVERAPRTSAAAAKPDSSVPVPQVAAVENEEEDLPPLPEGLLAEVELKDFDLKRFFSDPRVNPDNLALTRVDRVKAMSEVTSARAMMDVIESDLRVSMTEGMEAMRNDGYYVELGQGEYPEPVAGVLSAGELTEDKKLRIFYYYPDEFPDLYKKKEEKKKVAERALRRLIAMADR